MITARLIAEIVLVGVITYLVGVFMAGAILSAFMAKMQRNFDESIKNQFLEQIEKARGDVEEKYKHIREKMRES